MKTFLVLAAVSSLAAGKIPTATSFSAEIRLDATQTIGDVTGVAHFKVENEAVRYDVKLADLKQITDVVLLTGTNAITLYTGSPSQQNGLDASGILTSSQLAGLSLDQLTAAMNDGKTQVVVFTKKSPDGSIRGKVVPAPDSDTAPASVPKTTA